MLTMLRKRLQKDDEGFTLIELMVVVLIIAILIAIAIPTFLGAQNRARDRAAQSNLRNALTAVKTIATDDSGLFTSVTLATLQSAEGALSWEWNAASPTAQDTVAIQVATGATPNTVVLEATSASGKTFAICSDSNGEVKYADTTIGAGLCPDLKW